MADEARRLQILRDITAAFDAHDLDGILRHFADDCVFESPKGTEPHGTRRRGKEDVRRAFAERFEGIPDARYTDDTHFVAGDRGVSEWLLTGTTTDGTPIEVRGCDLWTFDDDDRIVAKRSFWKIRA